MSEYKYCPMCAHPLSAVIRQEDSGPTTRSACTNCTWTHWNNPTPVLWKPVQFQGLTALFGGFQSTRVLHFIFMSLIVGFIFVHVALVAIVPKTLVAMVTGRATARPHGKV